MDTRKVMSNRSTSEAASDGHFPASEPPQGAARPAVWRSERGDSTPGGGQFDLAKAVILNLA